MVLYYLYLFRLNLHFFPVINLLFYDFWLLLINEEEEFLLKNFLCLFYNLFINIFVKLYCSLKTEI